MLPSPEFTKIFFFYWVLWVHQFPYCHLVHYFKCVSGFSRFTKFTSTFSFESVRHMEETKWHNSSIVATKNKIIDIRLNFLRLDEKNKLVTHLLYWTR